MARGDVRRAASLLEVAAQRGRDASTLLRLATVRRSLGDLHGALKAAALGIELSPRNFLMHLLLGSLREAVGAIHGAERAYRIAAAHTPLDLRFQPAMAKQLEWANRRVDAAAEWRNRLLEWDPAESEVPLDAGEEQRMRGFRANILENDNAGPLVPPAFLIPGVRAKRFCDPSAFSGVDEVERQTDVIRAEFLQLAESQSGAWGKRLNGLHGPDPQDGRVGAWSMIPLIRNGAVVEEFAAKCPRTMEAARLLDLPSLRLVSPSLYFSVLEPNSSIEPHTGITNARLIAHFPLIVPDGCGFRVGGETRQWQTGKALIFDDMTEHEAWNRSDRARVVLIADLWRPELTTAERAAVSRLMDCPDVVSA